MSDLIYKYKFSLLSGVFFALSWNSYFPAISLFFAFAPLFYFQNQFKPRFIDYFNVAFISFVIFHLGTVWWIYKSSIPGFFAVIILNSLFMALALSLHYLVTIRFGKHIGYLSFIGFWLTFEFLHYHWEISWPFMNLGNWLGQIPEWVQWYEYTGILGGTLWILLVNIFLYEAVKHMIKDRKGIYVLLLIISILLLIIPIYFSYNLKPKKTKNSKPIQILIIQPNIDPYTEKYKPILFEQQINEQINLMKKNASPKTQLVIFPETSFPLYIDKDSLPTNKNIQNIRSNKPNLNIILGLFTYGINNADTTYYNTAICLNPDEGHASYQKSKLVPAVERTPFSGYFKFLKHWNVNFGGINSTLGTSRHREVFKTKDVNIAPVICYESVYGEFTSEFVRNGADLIAVITNDAWWDGKTSYEQILMHSQLRAIETRRQIVRSANSGISCLIAETGAVIENLQKNKKATLSVSAQKKHILTFYVKYGDFIGLYSLYISAIILTLYIISRIFFKL
ncbi:MAG: apolipoprotein N-acyltransferase [Bacteroidetes bacterium 4572_117]|nr:MAG: apolipoprotein N-acyltransferase [Bacteroidetes bacterium 4572_117]